ncbi:hypothetical protein FQR65_LT11430 [Abscondita terminalis]|nr:hypothetical protein FQR65_LT11430 [Abscondita terminalis]
MFVRPLSVELQHVANKELNEDVNRIKSDLEHMQNWIEKQPYLNDKIELTMFVRPLSVELQHVANKELNEDVNRIKSDLEHMQNWIQKQPYLKDKIELTMFVRPLSVELQHVANKELNEDVNRIKSDLEHMQNWIQKQPYLKDKIDERQLVTFLRGCKWSLRRTKDKLQYFYKLRSLLPEYFQNRDPFLPEIQNVLNKKLLIPLPKLKTPGSPRICICICSNMSDDIDLEIATKLFFMIIDILLNEDDNFLVSGLILITDYENVPLKLITQYTPMFMKKLVVLYEKAYPVRIRNLIGLNTPRIVEAVYNKFLRAVLGEKLRNKVYNHIYSTYGIVDKSLLPKEYGGEHDSLDELAKEWKGKVESYREWFLEDSRKCCDKNLLFDKNKSYNDEFGMEGSFRKLNVD